MVQCISNTLVQVAAIDQLAIHFAMESNLLHKDSDEAQRQLNKDADQSDESEVEDDGVQCLIV